MDSPNTWGFLDFLIVSDLMPQMFNKCKIQLTSVNSIVIANTMQVIFMIGEHFKTTDKRVKNDYDDY